VNKRVRRSSSLVARGGGYLICVACFFYAPLSASALELIDKIWNLTIDLRSEIQFTTLESESPFVPSGLYASGVLQTDLETTISLIALNIPISMQVAGRMINSEERAVAFALRRAYLTYFGPLVVQVGKQEIVYGYGDFLQPTIFLPGASIVRATDDRQEISHWALQLRYDIDFYTAQLFVASNEQSIEEQSGVEWVGTLVRNEFHLPAFELHLSTGHLYRRRGAGDTHALHVGVEGELFLFELFGLDARPLPQDWLIVQAAFNGAVAFDPLAFAPQYIVGIKLRDFTTASDIGYQISSELYFHDQLRIGFVGIIEISQLRLALTPQVNLENSDYILQASLEHIPNSHFSHSIAIRYDPTQRAAPVTITYSVAGSI